MLTRLRTLAIVGLLALPSIAAEPKLSVDARDAPVRAVIELISDLNPQQYQINNTVVGFVTVRTRDLTYTQTLDALSRASRWLFVWTQENGIFIVRSPKDAPNAVPELENLSSDTGFARVAAIGRMGAKKRAIVEMGSPPNSEVRVLAEGSTIREPATGTEWMLTSIGTKSCVLLSEGRKKTLLLQGLPRRQKGM